MMAGCVHNHPCPSNPEPDHVPGTNMKALGGGGGATHDSRQEANTAREERE